MQDNIRYLRISLTRRRIRWGMLCVVLAAVAMVLSIAMLLMGNTVYSPDIVWRVLGGEQVSGATFAIWSVRLPRLLAGLLAGLAFGISGNTFQTMLRNPLASPDMIGISSGAGVAAVFCILVLDMGKTAASFWAVAVGLGVAVLIYALSAIDGFSGGKLILTGIGMQAMMKSVISYLLLKAAAYDVPAALRWLSGSLNGVQMEQIPLLAATILPLAAAVILCGKQLQILEMGDSAAIMLGVKTNLLRGFLIICAVVMTAFATSVTGPISCVTFLAGPIATRMAGESGLSAVPAGLVGMVLVLASDLIGQFMLGTRFPVGVITGILGAPYLLYLLIHLNKKGSIS